MVLFVAESLTDKAFGTVSFYSEANVLFGYHNSQARMSVLVKLSQNKKIRVEYFKGGIVEDGGKSAGVQQPLVFREPKFRRQKGNNSSVFCALRAKA